MALSRNNHYIPQMYLSRWAANGRINVYKLLVSHEDVPIWSRQSVVHTASIKNAYVNVRNGIEYDGVEHFFDSNFEMPAKEAFDKLHGNAKMTYHDWNCLSDFVVAQYVRTPAFYLWVTKWGQSILPKVFDEIGEKLSKARRDEFEKTTRFEDDGLLPLDVKLIDSGENDDYSYAEINSASGKGLWLYIIKSVLDEKSTIKTFFRELKWSVIDAPVDEFWPTCDNPVVICDYDGQTIKRSSIQEGIKRKDKAIVFPISPRRVIFGTVIREVPWHIISDEKWFEMIREVIIKNAMLEVYSYIEDGGVRRIRPRIVDKDEYLRIKAEFESWYESYRNIEGPLLSR